MSGKSAASETPIAKRKGKRTAKKNVERRKGNRRVVMNRREIFLQPVDKNEVPTGPEVDAFITDISHQGLGLCAANALQRNSMLIVTIDSGSFQGDFLARVTWACKLPTSGHVLSLFPRNFRLGLEFLPQSSEDKDFVKMLFEEL